MQPVSAEGWKTDLLSLPQNTTKATKFCVTSFQFSSVFTKTVDTMIYYEHKHSWSLSCEHTVKNK